MQRTRAPRTTRQHLAPLPVPHPAQWSPGTRAAPLAPAGCQPAPRRHETETCVSSSTTWSMNAGSVASLQRTNARTHDTASHEYGPCLTTAVHILKSSSVRKRHHITPASATTPNMPFPKSWPQHRCAHLQLHERVVARSTTIHAQAVQPLISQVGRVSAHRVQHLSRLTCDS